MPAPLGNVKAVVPEAQRKTQLKPGDVSFRGFERKDNLFTVTFVWCDMIGGMHEHTFNRGDIFADFNKVLRIFTDGGLPVDLSKLNEFKERLCQLSTVMVQQEKPKDAPVGPAAKEEPKTE